MEPRPPDKGRLKELVSVQGEIEAKIIYGILESEGIRVLIKSNMASGASLYCRRNGKCQTLRSRR